MWLKCGEMVMNALAQIESPDSNKRTKQHSYKKPATYLGYVLLAPWALYTATLAQTRLAPFASADMSESQTRALLIVFSLTCAIVLTVKRQDFFLWSVCRFRSLRQFKSRDENRHRRIYKAMMFQSSVATVRQVLTIWGLFLGVHLLIASLIGLSLGWTYPGDISTFGVFGATAAVNLITYGIFSFLRLRREQKEANDPYHGTL